MEKLIILVFLTIVLIVVGIFLSGFLIAKFGFVALLWILAVVGGLSILSKLVI